MESRENISWVFLHVGPPLTISEGVDVVELKQGATTFGRGATADVYIDSLELKNFISRRHAVIVGERDEDGQLQFILHNHGLNGTYVNDVRIGEVKRLKEGDRVIFGHKNGYKVKVGETAYQPDSEFQFVLEKRPAGKQGVVPLGEHGQQGVTEGATYLSDTEQNQPSSNSPSRHGAAVTKETSQQYSGSAPLQKKVSDQNCAQDSHSRSPSRMRSEVRRSRSPRTDHLTRPSSTGAKYKTFTGRGSPKIKEMCAAKENKRCRSPRTKQEEEDGASFRRRHSDDGVLQSFQHKSTPDHSQKHSDEKQSSSPKPKQVPCESSLSDRKTSPKSKSLRRDQTSESPHANALPGPAGHSDRSRPSSRSRLSSFEDSECRASSPPKWESDESRSPSPQPDRSASRSPSPKPPAKDSGSRSPKSKLIKNRSRSPRPNTAKRKASPSDSSEVKSQSPCDKNRKHSGGYDEPPVLTPEYVRTPSSVVRTPSPHLDIERDEEGDDDDNDEGDGESMLGGIPPTPGHSFLEHSPNHSHGSRVKGSPQRSSPDVSPHSSSGALKSGEKRHHAGTDKRHHTGALPMSAGMKREASPLQQHHSRHKPSPEDHRDRHKDSLHKNQMRRTSTVKEQNHHDEPDSTTSCSDGSSSKSDESSRVKPREKVCKQKPDRDREVSYVRSSHENVVAKDDRKYMKVDRKSSALPSRTGTRNVFDEFLPGDSGKSKHSVERKRLHSAESDASIDNSSKPRPKSAKLHSKSYKDVLEKENGLTPGRDCSGKQTGHTDSLKEKRLPEGQMLKDVKVSIQRVTSSHHGRVKVPPSAAVGGQERQTHTSSPGNRGPYQDRHKQPSSLTKGSKPAIRENRERKDLSDLSLFGQEMERLGSMRLKEKTRTPRDKTLCAKREKQASSAYRTAPEKGKRWDKSVSDKGRDKPGATVMEKPRERRPQRMVKSRSQTPDQLLSSDETDRGRPGRKVAMRRPRQGKDSEDSRSQDRSRDQGERKATRQPKKRKRRRKKSDSDDEDDDDDDDGGGEDESLEEGVTWYEEDTCASDKCYRPADRRVQWVCCDDCDGWYHTVCVGIFLEDLKEDEDFHCGCA